MYGTIKDLALRAGVSRTTVYNRAKEIASIEGKPRLPTLEEVKPRPSGRPRKYL